MTTLRRIFVASALTCAAAWLVKMVAIAATGGADSDSVVVAVLWGLGMLGFLVAAATGTALVLRPLPVWARWLAGVIAVPVAFALLGLLDSAVKAVYDSDSWFRDEVALVLVAVTLGAVALRLGGLRTGIQGGGDRSRPLASHQ